MLAHELGHVRNRDTLTMTVAATLSGAIGMLATFGGLLGGGRDENGRPLMNPIVAIAAMILAPLAASLVQMAISRTREYEADRAGAEISGNPLWLASALAAPARGHADDSQRDRAGQSGDGASLYRQPAVGRRPVAACSRPIRRWRSASPACRRWRATAALRRRVAAAGDIGSPWRLGAANRPRPLGIRRFSSCLRGQWNANCGSVLLVFDEGHCPY